LRKFSALLHFVDGAVRKWDHFVKLTSPGLFPLAPWFPGEPLSTSLRLS